MTARWRITCLAYAAFLGSVLLLGPSVAAAPATATVSFMPPATMTGNVTVSATDAWLAMFGLRNESSIDLDVAGPDLAFRLIDASQEYVESAPGEFNRLDALSRNTSTPINVGEGALRLLAPSRNSSVVLRIDGDGAIGTDEIEANVPVKDAVLSGGGGIGSTIEPFGVDYNGQWPTTERIVVPGLSNHFSGRHLKGHYGGRFQIWITGAAVELRNASGRDVRELGVWRESVTDVPLHAGPRHWTEHHATLVGDVRGKLSWVYRGSWGHVLTGESVVRRVTQLSLPVGAAQVRAGGRDYVFNNQSFLDVRGLFDVAFPAPTSDGSGVMQVSLSGDVTQVMENRIVVHSLDGSLVAGAAAGVALAVLAILWLIRGGRSVSVFFSRNESTALGSPIRRALRDAIAVNPGIRQSELARIVPGKSSRFARYHLGVLCRAGLVKAVRSGNVDAYMPNAGSYEYALSAAQPLASVALATHTGEASGRVHGATALSSLSHSKRRLIWDALVQLGSADYDGLVAAWTRMKVPGALPTRSAVSRHARQMEAVGLLGRRRMGHRIQWTLKVDVPAMLAFERRRGTGGPSL